MTIWFSIWTSVQPRLVPQLAMCKESASHIHWHMTKAHHRFASSLARCTWTKGEVVCSYHVLNVPMVLSRSCVEQEEFALSSGPKRKSCWTLHGRRVVYPTQKNGLTCPDFWSVRLAVAMLGTQPPKPEASERAALLLAHPPHTTLEAECTSPSTVSCQQMPQFELVWQSQNVSSLVGMVQLVPSLKCRAVMGGLGRIGGQAERGWGEGKVNSESLDARSTIFLNGVSHLPIGQSEGWRPQCIEGQWENITSREAWAKHFKACITYV